MGSRQRRRYANLSVPRTKWDLRVELNEDGLRLDQFLTKRVKWKSRNEIREFFVDGQVTVNGDLRKASLRVKAHDQVSIAIPLPDAPFDPSTIPLHILFDDERLMVLNKQAGIVVHPTGIHQLDNLLSALHARYRNMDDPELDRVPHVCHRLDMHTSGVLLIAFDDKLKKGISLQFERREPRKEYDALLHGVPAAREGVIHDPIRFTDHGDPRLETHPDGLPSLTEYRVEETFGDAACRVRFFPKTGRTHQLRVHAASIGHPLLGDVMYGGRETIWHADLSKVDDPGDGSPPVLDRYALHAARLQVVHPDTQEPLVFEAPMHDDMVRAIEAFRAHYGSTAPS